MLIASTSEIVYYIEATHWCFVILKCVEYSIEIVYSAIS